jgi:hypothetical protein
VTPEFSLPGRADEQLTVGCSALTTVPEGIWPVNVSMIEKNLDGRELKKK